MGPWGKEEGPARVTGRNRNVGNVERDLFICLRMKECSVPHSKVSVRRILYGRVGYQWRQGGGLLSIHSQLLMDQNMVSTRDEQ